MEKLVEFEHWNVLPLSSSEVLSINGGQDATGLTWYLVQIGRVVDDFVSGFDAGFQTGAQQAHEDF